MEAGSSIRGHGRKQAWGTRVDVGRPEGRLLGRCYPLEPGSWRGGGEKQLGWILEVEWTELDWVGVESEGKI